MMKYITLLLLFFMGLTFLHAQPAGYKFSIPGKTVFDSLAGDPLTRAFPGIRSVKMVYRISDRKLYFIDSKKYPLHFSFCSDYFQDTDLSVFNQQNYSENPERKYYLATLNYFKDSRLYTLEFSSADGIKPQEIEVLFQALKDHFYGIRQLYLQLNTPGLMQHEKWNIPVIGMAELMGKQKLQIIQEGEVRGRLMLVDGDSLHKEEDYSQAILLMKGNTNEVPYSRGIICSTFQTPLSHVSVLSQNRGTPLVALREFPENINPLIGRWVKFSVRADTFLLELDTAGKGDREAKSPLEPLKMDTLSREIVAAKDLRMKDVPAYGVKAVYLGQLEKIRYRGRKIHTPEGAFAIPMYYYWQHLHHCGADTLINRLLKEEDRFSLEEVGEQLRLIQSAILREDPDKKLLELLEHRIGQNGFSEWIFR